MTSQEVAELIACLDKYLVAEGRTSLPAVEAAAVLERAGLLTDSAHRPGFHNATSFVQASFLMPTKLEARTRDGSSLVHAAQRAERS